MNKFKNYSLNLVAVLIFALFFFALVKLFGKEIPPSNTQVLLVLIGILAGKFGTVVDYFFGSSKGSADKNDLMATKPPEGK